MLRNPRQDSNRSIIPEVFQWFLQFVQPYFQLVRHQTSHKCHCEYPVEIHDSNHTHSLANFQLSVLSAAKKLSMLKSWDPTRREDCFSELNHAQERNDPHSANQSSPITHGHVVRTLWVHPPTSALLPISQGLCLLQLLFHCCSSLCCCYHGDCRSYHQCSCLLKASLVPCPSPHPCFDCLQYANVEGEGLGARLSKMGSQSYS